MNTKLKDLTDIGIDPEDMKNPDGFYDVTGNHQPYPEQCPYIFDDKLVVNDECGDAMPLTLLKWRSCDKIASLSAVFKAEGDEFFWVWEDNNARTGWSCFANEPHDICQFEGEYRIYIERPDYMPEEIDTTNLKKLAQSGEALIGCLKDGKPIDFERETDRTI